MITDEDVEAFARSFYDVKVAGDFDWDGMVLSSRERLRPQIRRALEAVEQKRLTSALASGPPGLKCPGCGDPLLRLASSHEPEGIRKDALCMYCCKLFMVTKSALAVLPPRWQGIKPPAIQGGGAPGLSGGKPGLSGGT